MERAGFGSLRPVFDAGAAQWAVDGVRPFAEHLVTSLVPAGFAAYARLFHPAWRGERKVRWATVAAAHGRAAHAGMQWPAIIGDANWDGEPWQGSLPAAEAHHLAGALSRFTSATDCYYAVWDGFAGLAVPPAATVAMPERTMVLLRGPLAEAATVSMERPPGEQSPSLWWPVDRTWCVATDVDLTTTYIGGSRACVDAIVAEPALEAWPIDARQGITRDSDDRNTR